MDALNITSLTFAYPGQQPVLSDVDWRLEQGEFALLTGPTGSGKTTLLRCLKPELAPAGTQSGSIAVFGEAIEALQPLESAQAIGYVGQDPENQVVCDTVWHEIAFGMENVGLDQALMRRRVAEIAHFFGIEPWMHQQTATLSGGQKQLVTLAGVLALQPKLLLLDEPTAQLDPVAEKNFLHALFRVNRELGITVAVATHAPQTMHQYATTTHSLDHAPERTNTPPAKSGLLSPETKIHFSDPESNAVSLRDLHFAYERNSPAVLRDLSLKIPQSQTHALVGGNGCGKSTLLQVVARALKPQQGRVDNPCVGKQALLPQDPKALFVCDTVGEELREWQQPLGYTDAEVHEIATALGIDQLFPSHPYDTSGGQQQLIALAKLMLTKPALLLLDEPTKGLDDALRAQVVACLAHHKRAGGTIILATHDMRLVELLADQVSLMFDGEIACTEPTATFFENNFFYRPENGSFPS